MECLGLFCAPAVMSELLPWEQPQAWCGHGASPAQTALDSHGSAPVEVRMLGLGLGSAPDSGICLYKSGLDRASMRNWDFGISSRSTALVGRSQQEFLLEIWGLVGKWNWSRSFSNGNPAKIKSIWEVLQRGENFTLKLPSTPQTDGIGLDAMDQNIPPGIRTLLDPVTALLCHFSVVPPAPHPRGFSYVEGLDLTGCQRHPEEPPRSME